MELYEYNHEHLRERKVYLQIFYRSLDMSSSYIFIRYNHIADHLTKDGAYVRQLQSQFLLPYV
jgi:hypothetical protein